MKSSQRDAVTHRASIVNSVEVIPDEATAHRQRKRRAGSDPKLRYFPESQFGGYSDIDQLVVFYTRVRSLLEPSFTVLDIGCGGGEHAERLTRGEKGKG